MKIKRGDSAVRCEMHSCLRYPVRLCRWFGAFPVEGLDRPDIQEMRFNVKSFYGLYCLFGFLGQFLLTILSIYILIQKPFLINKLTLLVFTFTGMVGSINMYVIAKKWPELMKKAAEVESRLVGIRISKRTHIKSNRLFFVGIAMALVETLSSLLFAFHRAIISYEEAGLTEDFPEYAIKNRKLYIYRYTGYNILIAIIAEYLDYRTTFLWTFQDILPMCFGVYLTSYFRDINKIIYDRVDNDASSWNYLRACYADVVTLFHKIDSRLCKSLLLAYATDLYFTCLQLFHYLKEGYTKYMLQRKVEGFVPPPADAGHDAYYITSLLLVLVRVSFMSLITAELHHEAIKPIPALHSAPASAYGLEIQRFHRQITYQTIALSGVFFHVTRPILLTTAGIIVTYLLFLLQAETYNVERSLMVEPYETVNSTSTSIQV